MRTGENIYKRKDGRWEARYRKGRNEKGKLIYGFCYGKTYTEAKNKLEVAKNSKPFLGSSTPKGNVPRMEWICEEWLRNNRLRLKPSTYVKYQTIIEKHIIPGLGDLTLDQVSTETVSGFGMHLSDSCGLAPKTVQDILVLLRTILQYARKSYPGICGEITVVYPKIDAQQMRVLSRAEQKQLTEYLLEDLCPCKFGILLALWTGIRIGELCALRWDQIDLEEGILTIEVSMQRLRSTDPRNLQKTSIVFNSPKTASSVRHIPLNDCQKSLCRDMAPEDRKAYVLTATEKFMEPRLLQYRFRQYLRECNLTGVTFHTLRHTFATRCVEVDFEIKSLSEILGHANTSITLNRYVHCSMELKRANMRKLETLNM